MQTGYGNGGKIFNALFTLTVALLNWLSLRRGTAVSTDEPSFSARVKSLMAELAARDTANC